MATSVDQVSGRGEEPNVKLDLSEGDTMPKNFIRLTDLADELLINIAQFINPYYHRASPELQPASFSGSLLHFALTSKRLFGICEPMMYISIQQDASKPLFPILWKVLTRPELAQHVRVFETSSAEKPPGETTSGHPSGIDLSILGDLDWTTAILEATSKLGRAYDSTVGKKSRTSMAKASQTKVLEAIEQDSWDVMVSLIIVHLPNLEIIRLRGLRRSFDDSCPYTIKTILRARALQEKGYKGSLALSSLHTAILDFQKGKPGGFELERMYSILKLPSIRSLAARQILEDSLRLLEGVDNWLTSPPVFHTKQLILTDAWIQPEVLVCFLACFPSLEIFHYEHGNLRQGHKGATHGHVGRQMKAFEPPRILEGLQKLKKTLKFLTVINDIDDWEESELSGFPVGSLTDFQQLKYLKISLPILIGVSEDTEMVVRGFHCTQDMIDCLPSSLEHLSICGIQGSEIIKPLDELLEWKDDQVPKLKRVDLHWAKSRVQDSYPFIQPNISKGLAMVLGNICMAASVELFISVKSP